jgi:hypothetical protein
MRGLDRRIQRFVTLQRIFAPADVRAMELAGIARARDL